MCGDGTKCSDRCHLLFSVHYLPQECTQQKDAFAGSLNSTESIRLVNLAIAGDTEALAALQAGSTNSTDAPGDLFKNIDDPSVSWWFLFLGVRQVRTILGFVLGSVPARLENEVCLQQRLQCLGSRFNHCTAVGVTVYPNPTSDL